MIHQKDSHYILEDDLVQIQVEPETGGKIRSFVSKKTGRNFFYVDKRKSHDGDGFSDGDISGMDECFPSIAPCRYTGGPHKGKELGDHGKLWDKSWNAEINGDCLEMGVELGDLDVSFNRSLNLPRPGCLQMQYRIENRNSEPLPFIYCTHMLLAGGPSTRFEFPEGLGQAFFYSGTNLPGLTDRTWIDWPDPTESWLYGPFSADRATAGQAVHRTVEPWTGGHLTW
jgi:hypothetical protein